MFCNVDECNRIWHGWGAYVHEGSLGSGRPNKAPFLLLDGQIMSLNSQMHLTCKKKWFTIVVEGGSEPQYSQLWSIVVDGFSLLSLALSLRKNRIRYIHANQHHNFSYLINYNTRCIWEWLQWLSFIVDGYILFVEVIWHVPGENFEAKTGEKVHMRQFLYPKLYPTLDKHGWW